MQEAKVTATSNPHEWGLVGRVSMGVCSHCSSQNLREVILPGMKEPVVACIQCAWVRTPIPGVTEQ